MTIFCPPAGAVASVVVASADMYSAASGKDWGTGRELDNTERGMRGAFALLDLIPAGKYLHGLAKTGKTAGLTAVKTSLKTGIKEGVEQGVKNFDNLKGLLKSTKGLADNMISQVKTYGKQLDNLRPSKILSNSADALSDGLRHADNVLSEAAQRFSLNPLKQLQPATGSIPFEGGKLTHIADNISAFAKNLDGSVDDVVEGGSDILVEPYRKLSKNKEIPGQAHHLNQNAAFTGVIPHKEGLSIKLEGNVLTDIGSPHYKAHESLEQFWNQYRKGGELYGISPTMAEYNVALEKSLIDAGLTPNQAKDVVSKAIEQQISYGLTAEKFVPRIPGKMNLPKIK